MIQFNLSGAEYQNNFQFKCFPSSNKLKIELLDYNRMKGSTDHFLNSDFGRDSVVFVSTQKKKKKKNPLELKSPSLTSCSFQATKSLSEGGCLKQAVAWTQLPQRNAVYLAHLFGEKRGIWEWEGVLSSHREILDSSDTEHTDGIERKYRNLHIKLSQSVNNEACSFIV